MSSRLPLNQPRVSTLTLLRPILEDHEMIETLTPYVVRAGWSEQYEPPELPRFLVDASRRPRTAAERSLVRAADAFLKDLPLVPSRSAPLPAERGDDGLDVDVLVVAALRMSSALSDGLVESRELRSWADRARHGLVPILKRFGMWDLKRRLEDEALRAATPRRYERIAQGFAEFRAEHAEYVAWASGVLADELARADLGAEVRAEFCAADGASRRLKTLGGQLSRTKRPTEFLAMRPTEFLDFVVLVPDAHACYQAIGLIHALARPAPGTFEDFVASPRTNGYSGLLSYVSLVRPEGEGRIRQQPELVRVVVQTPLMHEVGRLGIVHPVCYVALRDEAAAGVVEPFVRALLATVEASKAAQRVRARREIQVFTAGGKSGEQEAHTVWEGSTALDLAYKIHTDLGDGVSSVKVNGGATSLGHVLKEGEVILFTGVRPPGSSPRVEEDVTLVMTRRARHYLRRLLDKDLAGRGRRRILQYLERRGVLLTPEQVDAAAAQVVDGYELENDTLDSLYRKVADEDDRQVTPGNVGASIIQAVSTEHPRTVGPERPAVEWRPTPSDGTGGAVKRMRLCGRCAPVPGETIVGVRLRRHLTVHRPTCSHASDRATLDMRWETVDRRVRSAIILYCEDRPQLVHGICERLQHHGAGLDRIDAAADEYGGARVHLRVYSHSAVALGDLLEGLRTIRSVRTVKLEATTLSTHERELIETGDWRRARREIARETGVVEQVLIEPLLGSDRRRGRIYIPYRAQKPTHTSNLFFGREEEVAWLVDRVLHEREFVLITGPRRIGKTSLALRFVDTLPADERPHVVRVDLRDCKRASSEDVLWKIVGALSALRTSPGLATGDDPAAQIEARVRISDKPVLLILDEFAAVLESFQAGTLGTRFPTWIRTTMEATTPAAERLALVMVSPPECIELLQGHEVEQHLDRVHIKRVGALQRKAAYEMLMQALSEQGVRLHRDAAEEIVALTGARPYFIIIFLSAIVGFLNERRTTWEVRMRDLAGCRDRVLEHELCFHGTVNEPGNRVEHHRCLLALARLGDNPMRWISRAAVIEEAGLPADLADAALQRLVDYQLLEKVHDPGTDDRLRFGVPLVREWINLYGARELGRRPEVEA